MQASAGMTLRAGAGIGQLEVKRTIAFEMAVLALSILAIGCVGDAAPDAGASPSAKSSAVSAHGCYDPAQYGGIPDDDLDDRAAIQSAIDEASGRGGRVCLADGRWRISRAPLGSYNRAAGLTIHAPRVELSGNGPGTVIEVVGDQGAATIFVISVDSGARNITVRDLVIETSGMTNTEEQTHAIQIGTSVGTGSVEDVRIERVIFHHPRASSRKGDCLRMVGGEAPNQVRRVTVIGSTFTSCARSGIAIQRGVHDLVIMGNQFTQSSDQDIDSEPTALGGNSGVTIVGNVFRDDVALAQGDWSVSIGGYDGPMTGVTLANNVFEGRGVYLYHTANLVISGNTFNSTMESGYPVIHFGGRAETIVINGNTMRRRGVVDGPMLRIVHASGRSAQNVMISNNEMIQETIGEGIVTESVAKMTVVNNGIEWTKPAPSAYGIHHRSTIVGSEAIMISNNRLVGSIRYGILLGATNPFKTTSVVGNMTTGATTSLGCAQSPTGKFDQPIVFAANNFNSPAQCPYTTLVPSRP